MKVTKTEVLQFAVAACAVTFGAYMASRSIPPKAMLQQDQDGDRDDPVQTSVGGTENGTHLDIPDSADPSRSFHLDVSDAHGHRNVAQRNMPAITTSSQPEKFSTLPGLYLQIAGQHMGFYTCKTWKWGGKKTFWQEEGNGYCMDIPVAIVVCLIPCGLFGMWIGKMCGNIPWQPSKVVLVEGLPKDLTEEEIVEIRAIFARYGYLQAVRPAEKGKNWWHDPKEKNGKVLLRYGSLDEATWVVKNLHDQIPEGMKDPVQLSYDDPTDCIWDHERMPYKQQQLADLPAPPQQQQMTCPPDQYPGSDQYGYDPYQSPQGAAEGPYAPQDQGPPQGAGSVNSW